MDTVIETRGLTKRYGGDVCALYDADVSVRRGDIFGVVGDNGAGKTTLFKLLCGLAFPTEGEVRLFGAHEPRELERQRTRIGSIIESPGFYPGLSVEKNLECCRIRKGVPGKDAVARVLDTVGLAYAKDRRCRTLSLGMKQRLGLAMALLGEPEVLILDEPTNGLDPSGIVEMRAFLQGLNRDKGITIVISSHHLAELEQMATTYAFLKRGCVVEQVSARTLQERCADYVDIAVSDAARFTALLEKELRHALPGAAGRHRAHLRPGGGHRGVQRPGSPSGHGRVQAGAQEDVARAVLSRAEGEGGRMMLNYMKSELYRIVHGRELYLFTGVPCAIVLASSVLLWAMASTPDFPYATVRFSLSNLISMLPSLFLLAGLLVWVLFADDRKDGTFKNAVADGCSRRDLFVGKCLVSTGLGLASMTVILAVYVGSAVLLLEGPADAVSILLKGVAAALPFTVACVVLGVAVCSVLPKTSAAFLVWLAIVAIVPSALHAVGMVVEPVGALASWLPYNFFSNEVAINQSGLAEFLWDTPAGLAKCLIAGFAGVAVFGIAGLWRASKTEL